MTDRDTAALTPSGLVAGCARDICGDAGVPCTGLYGEGFRARSHLSTARGGRRLRCYVFDDGDAPPVSTCCHATPPPASTPDTQRWTMCPWPESEGGRQLLNIGSSPAPSDFYSCRNVGRDPDACGACGTVCAEGWGCCDSACVDLRSDAANCGACNRACAADRSCVAGVCECAPPLAECLGVCVDTSSDPRSCGGCGRSCGVDDMGNPRPCVGGVCI